VCVCAISTLVKGTQVCFVEKHWLLTWACELTKNRRCLASLSPFCTCCPLLWASLSCSHLGIMEGQEWSISWEPDGSPLVMTAMTSFVEPLWELLNWDKGQPEHTCDWDCLTMHTFVPWPQFFVYLNL
jgi:hypothetical protein